MARKLSGDSHQPLVDHIKSNFVEEWTFLSSVDISIHLETIQEQFDIAAIKSFIDNDIEPAFLNRDDRRKFHLNNLAREARLFADFLFVFSLRGKEINIAAIQQAKVFLKSTQGTTTYPC